VSQSAPGDQDLPVVDDLDEVVRLVTEHPDRFVRYSSGPAHDGRDGVSRDYESRVDMPGLSVTTVTPESWWPKAAEEWVARRLCKYEELGDEHDRFPWLLTGRIVGYGPDHEPLVTDVEPICRIGSQALARARRVYDECFNVAEDSRSSTSSRSG
jgi:hypothetical protein